jgi:hypothetical protein
MVTLDRVATGFRILVYSADVLVTLETEGFDEGFSAAAFRGYM